MFLSRGPGSQGAITYRAPSGDNGRGNDIILHRSHGSDVTRKAVGTDRISSYDPAPRFEASFTEQAVHRFAVRRLHAAPVSLPPASSLSPSGVTPGVTPVGTTGGRNGPNGLPPLPSSSSGHPPPSPAVYSRQKWPPAAASAPPSTPIRITVQSVGIGVQSFTEAQVSLW